MTEPDEQQIQDQAETVEPGSSEALEQSREAIDEAYDAARTATDQDVTDQELTDGPVDHDAADGAGPA